MSALVEIRAPAEQTEGTRSQILRWLKSVGDTVTRDEPLIEIETDKVTVEVAAPGSGVLLEVVRREQEEISPGELLGRIDSSAQTATAPVPTSERRSGATAGATSHGAGELQAELAGGERPLSPAVRRLLAERGLKSFDVRGSGPGGRVMVEDVLAHRPESSSGASAGQPHPVSPSHLQRAPAGAVEPESPGRVEPEPGITRVPHSATRKRIAEHMVQSLLHTAPHVTTVFEADLTRVLEHRQRKKEEFAARGVSLTLTAYFLQAAVAGIKAVPEVNSRWTDSALEIHQAMHIGVATAAETGLVVPVLRDAQSCSLFELARGLQDLVTRAHEGQLTPADVRGGTFTISNHGVSGSLVATPIVINQPQSAILGIGKLEKRPVVSSEGGADQLVIRPRCYVTLTIDHRVLDGHRANQFLQAFVGQIESGNPDG